MSQNPNHRSQAISYQDYITQMPLQHYIANQWTNGQDKELEVLHKYSQQPIATFKMASATQLNQAVAAADQAAHRFRHSSAEHRSKQLYKLYDLLEARQQEMAGLIVAESGKPISYAQTEVSRALTVIKSAAAEALTFGGSYVPIDFDAGKGQVAYTRRFGVGPVACITPFNFPLNLVMHKVAPALACGCPVILKPASFTPLSSMALAQMIAELDYEAGVFNLVVCPGKVAGEMLKDKRMRMFSFTGSDTVGWKLKKEFAHEQMKVALELGGNAPALVDETADIDQAVKKLAYGAYLYAGQICISTQIVYATDSIYNAFKEKLTKAVEDTITGDPAKDETICGPLIDKKNFERIAEQVEEALQAGATVLAGGKAISKENNVYAPTLLENVPRELPVFAQEVFGPVLILARAKDFEEGLALCNQTDYGLQAAVFTSRLDRMKQAHNTLEYGGIIINNPPGFRVDTMPYGGVKASGFGREGVTYTMEEMTEPRLLVF